MKLLIQKSHQGGNRDCISIGKTTISIKGDVSKRLLNSLVSNYGSVGFNESGNLCLYLSMEEKESFFKLWFDEYKNARISLNSKEHKKALSKYIGSYDVAFVNVLEQQGIREVILKKK
jgi:hypothetical protein